MVTFISQLDWTLFLSALVSSTLFPGGSEAVLIYRLNEGLSSPYMLVFMATSGNVLGSVLTYAMGRGGGHVADKFRWKGGGYSAKHNGRAEQFFNRYGAFSLLFAWLPILGDPLCLVAGVLRYHFLWFIALVSVGKLARYSLLAWVFL